MSKKKILMVCLGNICRSPTAEAIALAEIQKQRLNWEIDSAGTIITHQGEKADPRTIAHGKNRGYDITSISRPIKPEDFEIFDWIVGMDASNIQNLQRLCPRPEFQKKIVLVTSFASKFSLPGVPDPYHGDAKDFQLVIDILEDAIPKMIESFK